MLRCQVGRYGVSQWQQELHWLQHKFPAQQSFHYDTIALPEKTAVPGICAAINEALAAIDSLHNSLPDISTRQLSEYASQLYIYMEYDGSCAAVAATTSVPALRAFLVVKLTNRATHIQAIQGHTVTLPHILNPKP